jgi:hypothetical protein
MYVQEHKHAFQWLGTCISNYLYIFGLIQHLAGLSGEIQTHIIIIIQTSAIMFKAENNNWIFVLQIWSNRAA